MHEPTLGTLLKITSFRVSKTLAAKLQDAPRYSWGGQLFLFAGTVPAAALNILCPGKPLVQNDRLRSFQNKCVVSLLQKYEEF